MGKNTTDVLLSLLKQATHKWHQDDILRCGKKLMARRSLNTYQGRKVIEAVVATLRLMGWDYNDGHYRKKMTRFRDTFEYDIFFTPSFYDEEFRDVPDCPFWETPFAEALQEDYLFFTRVVLKMSLRDVGSAMRIPFKTVSRMELYEGKGSVRMLEEFYINELRRFKP